MEFFEFASASVSLFFSYNSDYKTAFTYSMIIGALIFALVYVFKAFGLYTIACREGYKKKWMAFVPIFNSYYIGVLSSKNKIRNIEVKKFSLAQAIIEAVLCVLYIIYFVALYLMLYGGYATPRYDTNVTIYGDYQTYAGLTLSLNTPQSLSWAVWVLMYLQNYFIYWINLVYVFLDIMVLIAFFQTYSTSRYILLSLFAAIFSPLKGILIFVVRNNKGKSYMEYVREQREKQYRMYQDYNRRNMNNPYNYNPYSDRTYTPPQDNPYSQPKSDGAPDDPFSEFGNGSGSNTSGSDPFDDLKK
jgi:hypothetical protein